MAIVSAARRPALPLLSKTENRTVMKAPEWIRLDNASIIYPSCRTKNYATLYRMAVALDEPVNTALLDAALRTTATRFPGLCYTLDKGVFWWFLRRLENAPVSGPIPAHRPFNFRRNGGYMFKVGAGGNRITLDMFHVLTDGTGGMTFLLTLTAEYLKLRYGCDIPAGKWILDTAQEPQAAELEDSFDAFSGKKGSLDREQRAYHVRGTVVGRGELNDIKMSFPSAAVRARAEASGATVTEFLAAVMIHSLQQVREADPRSRKRASLKLEIPVNLRPIFGSATLRNFSSYVHVGTDVGNGPMTFPEILEEVKQQKRLFVNARRLTTRIAANVALEDNLAIRCLPIFIKRPAINIINRLKGENYCSQVLSNLGNLVLPEAMAAHVRDIDFMLGRTRQRSGSVACLSYGGRLNLHFSRRIAESDFEDAFLRQMASLGLEAAVEHLTPSRAPEKAEKNRPMRWAKVGLFQPYFAI